MITSDQVIDFLQEKADDVTESLTQRQADLIKGRLNRGKKSNVVPIRHPDEVTESSPKPSKNRALWACVLSLAAIVLGDKIPGEIWLLLDKVLMLFP